MNLLFTGKGGAGSWAVRGEQLGRACGGTVQPQAPLPLCREADVIVAVKRVNAQLLETLRQSGRPWVLDVVDFYPQPACSTWSKTRAIQWVQTRLRHYRPSGVVWPNLRMQQDCDIGLPGLVLPHHHRPDIRQNPVREFVRVLGYEGAPQYLGAWGNSLLRECRVRGWELRINQGHLADMDIVVAFRDAKHNGYAQRHWKSNVKLANAHGSGTPFIGPAECGYLETAAGGEVWVSDRQALPAALDALQPHDVRERVSREFLNSAITIESCAARLTEFLHAILSRR